MKIYIEIEVNGPEEELAGAAQLIVDMSNAVSLAGLRLPGTNVMLSNYKVYKPEPPVVKGIRKKAVKKAAKKASPKKGVVKK